MSEIQDNIKRYLIKKAQETADAQKRSMDTLALKLVQNLEKDFNVGVDASNPASAISSTDQKDTINLTPANLKNLGALLTYLDENKLEFNNQLICRKAVGDPGNMDLKFSSVNVGERDQQTRQYGKGDFFANKVALKGYVEYLKHLSADKKNKVLEIMIGSLLSEMNEYLGPEDKVDDNTDSTAFDSFVSPSLQLDNPVSGSVNPITDDSLRTYPKTPEGVNRILKPSDLSSDTSFMRWLADNLGSVIKDGKPVKSTDEGVDCLALDALLQRAKRYLSGAQSQLAKSTAQKYITAVQNVANVKNCQLTDGKRDSGDDKKDGGDGSVYPDTHLDVFPGKGLGLNPSEQDEILKDPSKLRSLTPFVTQLDLKDQPSFEKWIKQNGFRADVCTALRGLYTRAVYYKSKARGPLANIAKYYVYFLKELSKVIKLADGKTCSLDGIGNGGPGGTKGGEGDSKDGGGDTGGTGSSGSDLTTAVRILIANLPLQESQIDYAQIITFYQHLEKFYSLTSKSQVQTYADQVVHQFISRDINISSTGWNADTYSLSTDHRGLIQAISARGLNQKYAASFLHTNQNIVNDVMADLNKLRQRVLPSSEKNPLILSLIAGIGNQIGTGTSTSGGVGQRNMAKLSTTLSRVNAMLGSQ